MNRLHRTGFLPLVQRPTLLALLVPTLMFPLLLVLRLPLPTRLLSQLVRLPTLIFLLLEQRLRATSLLRLSTPPQTLLFRLGLRLPATQLNLSIQPLNFLLLVLRRPPPKLRHPLRLLPRLSSLLQTPTQALRCPLPKPQPTRPMLLAPPPPSTTSPAQLKRPLSQATSPAMPLQPPSLLLLKKPLLL